LCWVFSFLFPFFFFVVLGFELSLHLKPFHQPFLVKDFFKIRFHKLFGLASNLCPPDLCLLHS
jgi:hypothetical protein